MVCHTNPYKTIKYYPSHKLEQADRDIRGVIWCFPVGHITSIYKLEKSKPESRGFETSRDLAARRLTA